MSLRATSRTVKYETSYAIDRSGNNNDGVLNGAVLAPSRGAVFTDNTASLEYPTVCVYRPLSGGSFEHFTRFRITGPLTGTSPAYAGDKVGTWNCIYLSYTGNDHPTFRGGQTGNAAVADQINTSTDIADGQEHTLRVSGDPDGNITFVLDAGTDSEKTQTVSGGELFGFNNIGYQSTYFVPMDVYEHHMSLDGSLVLHHDYLNNYLPHCLLSMDANTGYDLSYGGATLTLSGTTPQADGTLLFDAVGQYASVQDVIPVAESYWVEAWIRPETFGENDYGRLFDNGPAVWYLYGPSSTNRISFTASSYNAISTSADGSISLNTWQHVAISVRYDSGDGKMYVTFYINGVQSGTEQDAGPPLAGTTDLFLGNRSTGDRTFDGSMSTPRIFRGEATVSEIIARADERCPTGVAPSWVLGPELATLDNITANPSWTYNSETEFWTLVGDGSAQFLTIGNTSGTKNYMIDVSVVGNNLKMYPTPIPTIGWSPMTSGRKVYLGPGTGGPLSVLRNVGVSNDSIALHSIREILSPMAAAVASIS